MSGETPSDGGKLSNPFAASSSSNDNKDGFIAFSASTPQTQTQGQGNFKPR
jgi:hypothetical protein